MPGWKRDLGKRLDALIVRTVPNVRKAVKWNSPFYGIEGPGLVPLVPHLHALRQGDLLSRHVAATGPARRQQARYFDIHEDDELDKAQWRPWIKQAAVLPGWVPGRPS